MQPARSCSCIQTIVEDPGAAVGCSLHPDGQFTLPVGEVADEREADVERSARPRLVDAAFGSGSEISGARRWKFYRNSEGEPELPRATRTLKQTSPMQTFCRACPGMMRLAREALCDPQEHIVNAGV